MRITILAISLILSFSLANADNNDALVLVTSASSPIEPLSKSDLRRLYMGVSVKKSGKKLVPVVNTSDTILWNVFLQNVMFMSQSNYVRQLRRRAVKYGTIPPVSHDNMKALIDNLKNDKNSITFVWSSVLTQHSELKVIQALWQPPVSFANN